MTSLVFKRSEILLLRDISALQVLPRLWVQAVYEDKESGLEAKQIFDALQERFQAEADCRLDLWRFDLLEDPGLRRQAGEMAQQSEVVLLVAHGLELLPQAVRAWLGGWLKSGVERLPMLAVLLSAEAIGSAQAADLLEELRRRAQEAGAEMLHQFSAFPQQRGRLSELMYQPLQTMTPMMRVDGAREGPFLRRHWGINE